MLKEICSLNLNVLFLLGLALFFGTIGGRLFKKLKIPQVVGYIAIGILIGESGLKFIGGDVVNTFQPFSYFALGIIGFMIGGELKKEVLVKYRKQFVNILLFQGITPFILVSILVGVTGGLLFGDYRSSWILGLLLGAIASATAPAATSAVLQEYRTRGPLTRTVLGIVALDDGLALLLFAIASSVAFSLSTSAEVSMLKIFAYPLYEITSSIVLGILAGLILKFLIRRYTEESILLTFSIGTVLLIIGIAITLRIDMLLAAMTLGVVIANLVPRKSEEVFNLVKGFASPIYVLFFVLVGAKLDIQYMSLPVVLLGVLYLIGRVGGKALGANFGARISKAPKSVQKYLPLCLLSQAGVAIGLSILANHYFPGEIGNTIIIIVTATVFILEIIGPPLVKVAVTKAGEIGLNITEEDIIKEGKAKDFMDKNPPLICENMKLSDIIKMFSESDNLYYPVVNEDKKMRGIITVEGIRQTILDTDVGDLILAHDFMEPVIVKIFPDTPIFEVKEILHKYNIEYLPVTDKEDKIKGFIESKKLDRVISTKIIELQKQADSLG